MKPRRAALIWVLVWAVVAAGAVYFLELRPRNGKVTLEFVRHGQLGSTPVAIFRLKAYRGFRGELDNQGEVIEEGACYGARWFGDSNRRPFVVGGEQEFAVITPHKGAWQLRLKLHRPGDTMESLRVRLRATCFVLRHQPLRSRAVIRAIWDKNQSFSAAAFEAQSIMRSVHQRIPLRVVAAIVPEEPASWP